MSANRRRAFLVSAVFVGAAMLTTACQDADKDAEATKSGAAQGSSSAPAAGTGAPPAAASNTVGSTGASSGGGTAPTGKSTGGQGSAGQSTAGSASGSSGSGGGTGKAAKCRTDDLKITAMDSTISGDPNGTVAVMLKNSSGRDCTMSGYAGVDLKTSAGSLSAQRTGQETVAIVLKNGESVSFGIDYPRNDSGGSGVSITGLLVTPPDETKSVTLGWPGVAALPVTEGPGSPVKVGPLGSAGQGG
ncbi:DUF4232 domain-containing protein [Yinghuangia soli]|uniref:DUF4232 domain-containing protein n=1 Tax=Yinghuangia soli TaxID=2908204 RepID=A0AA41U4W5_9ACTN|nr:DUF4232 domain-containing protein [Yinghuangia soli]MCF2529409.1 DUF4232 domain-containing protein [Yinghuangia soli]